MYCITLYYILYSGSVVAVDISPGDTVGQVKHKIFLKEDIPPDQQQLIFSGMSLSDDHMINTYNIQRDSTVHLVIKMSSESGGRVRSDIHAPKGNDPSIPSLHHMHSATNNDMDPLPRPLDSRPHPHTGPAHPQRGGGDLLVLTYMTQSGKRARVNTHSNDTVLQLKEAIGSQENIQTRQQGMTLHLGDRELTDTHTLADYRLSQNTTLLMQVYTKNVSTLFVKTLNGKTYILYPAKSATVANIKEDLAAASKIPSAQQRLVFQGLDLPDHQTLPQCNVPPQCTLHVIQTNPPVNDSRPRLPILIKTFTGKTITVFATQGDRVRDIKSAIHSKEGYPPDEVVIMMGGNELEDDKVLDHYQIQQGSTLLVTFKTKEKLDLVVLDVNRSEMVCLNNVSTSDTIEDLQQRLSVTRHVPCDVITLVCKGLILNKHSTIEQCRITKDNNTLHMYTNQPCTLTLTVQTIAGIQCPVTVDSHQSVAMVKGVVQEVLGVPVMDQVLSYKGSSLEDDNCISDYISLSGSTVHLFVKRGIDCNLTITVPNASPIILTIPSDTTVSHLMGIIGRTLNTPCERVVVCYRGNEMESPYTLGDYAITDGAVLAVSLLSNDPFIITVQSDTSSRSFTLRTDRTDNVLVLRHKVATVLGVPVRLVCLLYCGTRLIDRCQLCESNLSNPCVVFAQVLPQ